ncbi:MAG: Transposase [Bacteroidetes bacterium]|nr:Transposase [Bacteroidota bacterium]
MGCFYQYFKKNCPNSRLVHDKFHVVKYLTNAIDLTRREEVKIEPIFKKTRFIFLKRLDTMTDNQRITFELENISNTKTASAWRMRENFIAMYECQTSEQALHYFNAWYKSVIHSSNKHIKIKKQLKLSKNTSRTSAQQSRTVELNKLIVKLLRFKEWLKAIITLTT